MAIDVNTLSPMELCALVKDELAAAKKARMQDVTEEKALSEACNKADEILARVAERRSHSTALLSRACRLQKYNDWKCQKINEECKELVREVSHIENMVAQVGEQIELLKHAQIEDPIKQPEYVEDHPLSKPLDALAKEEALAALRATSIEKQIALAMLRPVHKSFKVAIPSRASAPKAPVAAAKPAKKPSRWDLSCSRFSRFITA